MSEYIWFKERFKPSSKIFLLTVPRRHFFCGSFVDLYVLCISCFHLYSLLPCGHLLGKGWPLGSCLWCLIVLCHFPMWYPGSGVVLDCIDSWSLPPLYFGIHFSIQIPAVHDLFWLSVCFYRFFFCLFLCFFLVNWTSWIAYNLNILFSQTSKCIYVYNFEAGNQNHLPNYVIHELINF